MFEPISKYGVEADFGITKPCILGCVCDFGFVTLKIADVGFGFGFVTFLGLWV